MSLTEELLAALVAAQARQQQQEQGVQGAPPTRAVEEGCEGAELLWVYDPASLAQPEPVALRATGEGSKMWEVGMRGCASFMAEGRKQGHNQG